MKVMCVRASDCVNGGCDRVKVLHLNMCNLGISCHLDFSFHCTNSHYFFFLSELHKKGLKTVVNILKNTTLSIIYVGIFFTWLQNPSMPKMPRMNALYPTYTVDNESCI